MDRDDMFYLPARGTHSLTDKRDEILPDEMKDLVGKDGAGTFANRRHFFGAAAEAMRRILVDQARRKGRDKHGGALRRVELQDPVTHETGDELLALDAALRRLAAEDPLAAEVVKLKYFAGLGREEIAATLGRTVHEIRQKWAYARAWLRLALEG